MKWSSWIDSNTNKVIDMQKAIYWQLCSGQMESPPGFVTKDSLYKMINHHSVYMALMRFFCQTLDGIALMQEEIKKE